MATPNTQLDSALHEVMEIVLTKNILDIDQIATAFVDVAHRQAGDRGIDFAFSLAQALLREEDVRTIQRREG